MGKLLICGLDEIIIIPIIMIEKVIIILGGSYLLLGMSFVSDMHIMECEQFLSFI